MIDSVMVLELAAQGDGLGVIMVLTPLAMGNLVKSQIRARTSLSPQVKQ